MDENTPSAADDNLESKSKKNEHGDESVDEDNDHQSKE